jgi:hypothetical protein
MMVLEVKTMAIEAQPIDRPSAGTEKSAIDARQGVISGRIFLVLTTSLILTVVAIGVAFWAVT